MADALQTDPAAESGQPHRRLASIPDSFLEALALAPLTGSCLRLAVYLARRTHGSDAGTIAATTAVVRTKTLCRVLDLTHPSVQAALRTLRGANVISIVPGEQFEYGLTLNLDVSTWGRGLREWDDFHERLAFEQTLGSFRLSAPLEPATASRRGRPPRVNREAGAAKEAKR